MDLASTRDLLPRVIWRDAVGSTNAELRELARSEELPHGTLLATADQTAGRGRLERGWVTPPGKSLATSILIRGFAGSGSVAAGSGPGSALGPGWLPLLVGSAMAASLQPRFPEGLRVGVKWPNDVHVRDEEDAIAGRPGQKLCGILCEMLPDGSIIVGAGINVLVDEWELPTERATSLLAAGAEVNGAESLEDGPGPALADALLSDYASRLLSVVELAAGDPDSARVRVRRSSLTLGAEVRVHLPGGEIVDGRARDLAEDGSLVVDLPTGGMLTVSAGDVEHLRSRD
ncbi:biotin--[acetyl-CoA-carboxylase] ligase [Leucobacter sp. CSA2]|uniref:biotin--[biotin carboxyl-carrier protein] ligase n=1 Tax=Leucobacter edaphi TaxID=2796472 RepID=A0A934UYB5_9MICO|nr:biotin--[acetyl-CoA-carboxylase] ligase [Leucobacter edaphi]MBK0422298.1 biotin--[acetyl-CoA-carboxylase] ligase [Leucobacter edaphi]